MENRTFPPYLLFQENCSEIQNCRDIYQLLGAHQNFKTKQVLQSPWKSEHCSRTLECHMLTKHLSDLWLGVGNLTFEGRGGGCLKDFENKFPARAARQKKIPALTNLPPTLPLPQVLWSTP